jgi:hypothetical protein
VSYLDETHQRISEFAEEFLEEDEREGFVDSLMERRGYKRSSHWEPPDPDNGSRQLIRNKGGRQQQGAQGGQRSYFSGNRK